MDSEKLNSWLTLTANFGVVIGIALLVYELRETQNLTETEAAVNGVVRSAASFQPYWEELGFKLGNSEFHEAIREEIGK